MKKIAAVSSLIVVLLLPLFFVWNSVFPWDDAIDELALRYPEESYIYLGGSTKWSSRAGKQVKKYYLLLPSGTVLQVKQRNGGELLFKHVRGGLLYYVVSLLILSIYFVFFGVPVLKEMFFSSGNKNHH
jgi:hypothetical protein